MTARVQEIYLSRRDTVDGAEDAIDAGADDFLLKPVREPELFAKIGRGAGVRYLYVDAAEHAASRPLGSLMVPGALAALSPEVVKELREAVAAGDFDRIQDAIDRAAKDDAAAAHGLRDLADGFEYDTLLTLLNPNEDGSEPM